MTAVEVRPADDSDVEATAAIYVNAARAGWAHINLGLRSAMSRRTDFPNLTGAAFETPVTVDPASGAGRGSPR